MELLQENIMNEIRGNLWAYYNNGEWVCITTNGTVKGNGDNVMGGGCAFEALQYSPSLSRRLGKALTEVGNIPIAFPDLRIITFPVKDDVRKDADISLIILSAQKLIQQIDYFNIKKIYIPHPGCGLGNLDWKDVKKELEPIFDDRFIIVTFVENIV